MPISPPRAIPRRDATKRLAVLGWSHETNTFSSTFADLPLYQDGGIQRGDELVKIHGESQSAYAGYLEEPGRSDVELVPLVAAWVNPCGRITAEAFEYLAKELRTALEDDGPWHGVLLHLHGAAVAENHDDADLRIARMVRRTVGPEVVIGLVVDMHANLSPEIADLVDVLMPYQTNPHVDARRRGVECRRRVLEVLDGGPRPAVHIEPLPLIVNIVRQDTAGRPMHTVLEAAQALMADPGVWDASVVEGFPYCDVPQMGMSVSVTHADGAEMAASLARALAAHVWHFRDELQGGGWSIPEVLATVRDARVGEPVLVLDVGDNVGGGGPGDSTALLEAALAADVPDMLFTIHDPKAVASLARCGVGETVTRDVGGWSRESPSAPVQVIGRVVGWSDGHYEEPVVAHGGLRHFDSGTTVAITTDHGVTIILTSKLVQPITVQQLYAVGVSPRAYRAIVAKGVNGPRAGFGPYCGRYVIADTPGITRLSVEQFEYRKRRIPLYPFERHASYPTANGDNNEKSAAV